MTRQAIARCGFAGACAISHTVAPEVMKPMKNNQFLTFRRRAPHTDVLVWARSSGIG